MTVGTSSTVVAVAPELFVEGVTVRVRARTILAGVGFQARAGEIVAIIGPNGAGKTTLLEVIAGVRSPSARKVAFRGAPARGFSDRARHLAFLPDQAELPSELRVKDVVEHVLAFKTRPPALLQVLRAALGVEALLHEPVGVLSRGERARLSLFCVLAVDRLLAVLDEPFSAFDPLQLRDVLGAVRRVAESGAAIVATVHHLSDAGKVADRFLILAEGRRLGWGDLATLRRDAGVEAGSLEDVFVALLERRPDAT